MWLILALLFLNSCSDESAAKSLAQTTQIKGREQKGALFEIQTPLHWQILPPLANTDLSDTTKNIMEWKTPLGNRITLHTFSAENNRISFFSQIARWKSQIQPIGDESITMQSFAGFKGYLWEGYSESQGVLAWTMHLANEHFFALWQRPHMQVDWTLKATGNKNKLLEEKEEIIAFARTLEFVEEI